MTERELAALEELIKATKATIALNAIMPSRNADAKRRKAHGIVGRARKTLLGSNSEGADNEC